MPEKTGGVRESRSLDMLELEYGNLRTVLAWLESSEQTDRLIQLTGALGWFWHLRGHLTEGRSWLDRAVAKDADNKADTAHRARALRSAGLLAWEQGDFTRAAGNVEQALAISADIDDRPGVATALLNLGVVQEKQGDDVGAMAYYEQALAIYRELNNTGGITHTVMNMGDTAYRQGDLERSALYTEEALTLSRRMKDPMYTALSLTNAGQLALARGETTTALGQFRESLKLAVETHNDWFVADALGGLAGVAVAAGDPERAARWLGTAQTICDAIGTPAVPHHALFAHSLSEAKAALSDAQFSAAWDEGRACSTLDCVADTQQWQGTPAAAATPVRPAAAPPKPVGTATSVPANLNLTERELDVLRLVVEGKSSREIAEELYISPRTATTHVANILSKLGVNSRSAAVAVAFQSGLV